MARLKFKPSDPPQAPARGVKAATFKLLLDTAMEAIQCSGHVLSVAEVAVRARVSRATAYRYFPSRGALITAVIGNSLGPVREFSCAAAGGRERVRELFAQTFPRFKEFEPQMRAALQLSLEQWAQQRAGALDEELYRRGHRVRILNRAIAPLAATLPPALHERLHKALSVIYGIESHVILKDIWGASQPDIERTVLWMADALIDAALREAATEQKPARRATGARPPLRRNGPVREASAKPR